MADRRRELDPPSTRPRQINGLTIYNCTPHVVAFYGDSDASPVCTFQRCGTSLRVQTAERTTLGRVGPVPVRTPQDPIGFSEDDLKFIRRTDGEKTIYITSDVTAQALVKLGIKGSVLGPDTSPDSAVRDADGNIKGSRYLVCYNASYALHCKMPVSHKD